MTLFRLSKAARSRALGYREIAHPLPTSISGFSSNGKCEIMDFRGMPCHPVESGAAGLWSGPGAAASASSFCKYIMLFLPMKSWNQWHYI